MNVWGSIYAQSLAVLDVAKGSTAVTTVTLTGEPCTTVVGTYTAPPQEILRRSFATVPTISELELNREYQELGEALKQMTAIDHLDDWQIESDVYYAACSIAAELLASSFPAPRVFTHGPKSVVFNWSDNCDDLYLTISADRVSALISSPDRIKRRVDLLITQLLDSQNALTSIRAAYYRKPVKLVTASSTVDDLPKKVIGF